MKVKEPDLTEQIREIFGTTDAKELRQNRRRCSMLQKKRKFCKQESCRQKEFFYRSTACEYPCVAEAGCEDYRNCKKVPCIQTDDLQSDKTCA